MGSNTFSSLSNHNMHVWSLSGNLLPFDLSDPLVISVPFNCRVTKNVEELAPQFQVS